MSSQAWRPFTDFTLQRQRNFAMEWGQTSLATPLSCSYPAGLPPEGVPAARRVAVGSDQHNTVTHPCQGAACSMRGALYDRACVPSHLRQKILRYRLTQSILDCADCNPSSRQLQTVPPGPLMQRPHTGPAPLHPARSGAAMVAHCQEIKGCMHA